MIRRLWTKADEHTMFGMHLIGCTVPQIARKLGRASSVIRSHAKASGLKFKPQRKPWAEKELQTVRDRYPDEYSKVIAKDLGRTEAQVYNMAQKLGLKKSAAYWASDKSTRIKRGKRNEAMRANQFEPGLTPWNKGTHGITGDHPNTRKTQFKKGNMTGAAQRNYKPIGAERVTRDGVLERKMTDAGTSNLARQRRWVPVHRMVWESDHGPIPSRHVVRFKDGMHTTVAEEITSDKLECISQAENMRRNSYHRYPQPIPQLIQLRGALTRKINNRTEKDCEEQN